MKTMQAADERVPPVKKDDVIDVVITETAQRGDGVCRVGPTNFVIFVADTEPGDNVSIRIKHVLQRYAVGEVVDRS